MAPAIKEQKELKAALIGVKPSVFFSFKSSSIVCFSNFFIKISLWVETDIHSPPAIEQAPASIPERPAINRVLLSKLAPLAPNTIPETEIIPSLAPKIPALMIFSLSQKHCDFIFIKRLNVKALFKVYSPKIGLSIKQISK